MKASAPLARLGYALRGLAHAWKTELTFRIQVLAAIAAAASTWILQPGLVWTALVAVMIGAVLAAELINTALEHALDGLHPAQAEFVRIAKDCAAAAVLALSAAAVVVFILMVAAVLCQ
jgi:diacylglycerol kinase (ATP)